MRLWTTCTPGRRPSRTRWRPGTWPAAPWSCMTSRPPRCEGRTCPLGAVGHPKDGVRGRLQIVYGLLTSKEGIPVAIEVFKGNTGDPTTVAAQVAKVKDRFAIDRVVLVGDRGMLTAARLREDVAPAGLDWITARNQKSQVNGHPHGSPGGTSG